jgi:sugar lactone lactonase YvrE
MTLFRTFAQSIACVLLFHVASAAQEPPAFTIDTVAGTGRKGFSGDGGPAKKAQMGFPTAVAVDSHGNVYIADELNHRVRMVNAAGIITTIAGTGETRRQNKDVKARKTNLVSAYGIAVDHQDNLYILSRGHAKIFRIDSGSRKARTIAGNGKRGYNGDGIPATEAEFNYPNHLVADDEGNLYIADTGNDRIRKIDTQGIVTTVAGTGIGGYSGDGGPAVKAQIDAPAAIAMDTAGNLFVADFFNHSVRKIDTDGIISTVAGTGEPGYNGDNIPATKAMIGEPCGVAIDADGTIYIGDQVNGRVRAVTPDGIIHTVAGTGQRGYSGDGGPAETALLKNPDIIAFGPDGSLYIPDNRNCAVRVLRRK